MDKCRVCGGDAPVPNVIVIEKFPYDQGNERVYCSLECVKKVDTFGMWVFFQNQEGDFERKMEEHIKGECPECHRVYSGKRRKTGKLIHCPYEDCNALITAFPDYLRVVPK